jgi:two-component system response regulator FixJ
MNSSKAVLCIVDDDVDVCDSIKAIAKAEGIRFAAFRSAEEFLAEHASHPIGCMLLDVRLPGMSGTELLQDLRAKDIYIPAIVLTAYADVSLAVMAMKLGAADVLQKPFRAETLVERVQLGFKKWEFWKKFQAERHMVAPKVASLTRREVEVLDLMVAGVPNRKIASQLGISPKTLDIHRANVMRKFGTKTISDLVRWRMVDKADRSGLIPMLGSAS